MNVHTKLQAIELYTLGRDMDLTYEQMKEALIQYTERNSYKEDDDKYIQLALAI